MKKNDVSMTRISKVYGFENFKQFFFTLSIGMILFQSGFSADPETFQAHLIDAKPNSDGADQVVFESAGAGWFANLGPTGIRAMLTDDQGLTVYQGMGTEYAVKYIFANSPASGKVEVGDIIIGVNGQRFQSSYKFGYWFGFGYEGPLTEIGAAVEDAEANGNGVLDLFIDRNGNEISVSVQLPLREGFSETWPFDCPKSAKLKNDAIAWLAANQKDNGRWPGQYHAGAIACLALLAQGDTYLIQAEKYLDSYIEAFNDNTWNWQLAMTGLVMAEYTMATGNEKYKSTMEQINGLLKKNRRFGNGTYGHEGNAGSDGYGPMAGMTTLVALSWAMMEKAGIVIHKDLLDATMTTLDMELTVGTQHSGLGGFGYGWGPDSRDSMYVLEPSLVPPSLTALDADITEYSGDRGGAFPKGAMAALHSIYPWQSYSPQVAEHFLNLLAQSRRVLINGHGSGVIHGWLAFLGLAHHAAKGKGEQFRMALDANFNLLNSARMQGGSFFAQPQRDDLGGDYGRASRTLPTALWATILSVPDRNLVLFGSQDGSVINSGKQKSTMPEVYTELVHNRLTIQWDEKNPAEEISIVNIFGRMIKTFKDLDNGAVQWELTGRESGLYIIRIRIGGESHYKKLML